MPTWTKLSVRVVFVLALFLGYNVSHQDFDGSNIKGVKNGRPKTGKKSALRGALDSQRVTDPLILFLGSAPTVTEERLSPLRNPPPPARWHPGMPLPQSRPFPSLPQRLRVTSTERVRAGVPVVTSSALEGRPIEGQELRAVVAVNYLQPPPPFSGMAICGEEGAAPPKPPSHP